MKKWTDTRGFFKAGKKEQLKALFHECELRIIPAIENMVLQIILPRILQSQLRLQTQQLLLSPYTFSNQKKKIRRYTKKKKGKFVNHKYNDNFQKRCKKMRR